MTGLPRLPMVPLCGHSVLLHPDSAALGALPLSFLVVDVPLQFLHPDSAFLAGHYIDRIAPTPIGFTATLSLIAPFGAWTKSCWGANDTVRRLDGVAQQHLDLVQVRRRPRNRRKPESREFAKFGIPPKLPDAQSGAESLDDLGPFPPKSRPPPDSPPSIR